MRKRLRYADLKQLGIVANRVTLQNWIRDRGFPSGQLTGPNCRTWGEAEVEAWLAARPPA
jgi:predicted DNA-binding transcriptional regulator AlpA